jgi:hypothetical protein
MSIEVMKQALEALEHEANKGNDNAYQCERDALRTAIEQAEKPVAWVCEGISSDEKHSIDYQQEDIDALPVGTMLYTTPPVAPRQWVGLTDEELDAIYAANGGTRTRRQIARAIEAKLKEKNDG